MPNNEKQDIPQETIMDAGYAIFRAGFGAIPFLGAAAIEVFNWLLAPPIQKRRDEWMRVVAERLQELEEEGEIDFEELANNEVFTTTMLQASEIAIRNHHEEKLEALRNAVVNASLPNPPDESKQLIFLNFVDTFTVWHIRMLRLFQNPKNWFEVNGKQPPSFAISSSLSQLLIVAYPEMKNERALYDLIANELEGKGLLLGGGMHTMMSATGAFQKRTTSLGDEFIHYITID